MNASYSFIRSFVMADLWDQNLYVDKDSRDHRLTTVVAVFGISGKNETIEILCNMFMTVNSCMILINDNVSLWWQVTHSH